MSKNTAVYNYNIPILLDIQNLLRYVRNVGQNYVPDTL